MSYKFPKTKQGFSLAELLVVVAIIIIMTGVMFASMSGNKSQKDAENAARQVASQLRQLQNEAINGKQINDKIVCYFDFNYFSADKGYKIAYRDCPDGEEAVETSPIIKLNSGKGNVSIDITDTTDIYFEAPHGIYSGPLQITFTSNDKRAYVCVCSSGNIFDTKESSCSGC